MSKKSKPNDAEKMKGKSGTAMKSTHDHRACPLPHPAGGAADHGRSDPG